MIELSAGVRRRSRSTCRRRASGAGRPCGPRGAVPARSMRVGSSGRDASPRPGGSRATSDFRTRPGRPDRRRVLRSADHRNRSPRGSVRPLWNIGTWNSGPLFLRSATEQAGPTPCETSPLMAGARDSHARLRSPTRHSQSGCLVGPPSGGILCSRSRAATSPPDEIRVDPPGPEVCCPATHVPFVRNRENTGTIASRRLAPDRSVHGWLAGPARFPGARSWYPGGTRSRARRRGPTRPDRCSRWP